MSLFFLSNADGGEAAKIITNNKIASDESKENVLIGMDDEAPVSLPLETAVEDESLPALIKAAPEPTRVKSPESLYLVRSPEPVNWTVPLDTGKTFTVTQNIRGGEGSRPHSELKVSMTVRPSPTPPVTQSSGAVAAAAKGSSSEPETASPLVNAVEDEAKVASPPPAAPAAAVTAIRPAKAPGTPPHDSLGYFSEPEVIVECCSPSSELSEI